MPKCKINGHEVEVPAGSTIIEAFKKLNADIAHYCWHPGLSVAGVCRLCMVEIEGQPRMQIACNTEVKDGMVINNVSEKVKDTVRWGMDFHLINHPLDCPICDQAGECGLQEQYMKYGKYDPEMAEPKVKKHKVVSLGPTVVLDSERCILCSRCVRFTDEVSKTNELGIFNRGDRSEIGTFDGKPLDNKYSLNTVDICPVGALTSKDFRFRQRVWYLQEADTICTGCSTGCNVKAYYNEEGMWRIKPRHNPEVNGYWMCDEGRDVYKYVNKQHRLLTAKVGHKDQWSVSEPIVATQQAAEKIRQVVEKNGADAVALVLTGQYTNEEYKSILGTMKGQLKSQLAYHWINNPSDMQKFDGLLIRGDKNPNTKGLEQELKAFGGAKSWDDLISRLKSGKIRVLIVAGPENQAVYPDIAEKAKLFTAADMVLWLSANPHESFEQMTTSTTFVPSKTYIEKNGTFVNFQGRAQVIHQGTSIVTAALTLTDVARLLTGEDITKDQFQDVYKPMKANHFTLQRGNL